MPRQMYIAREGHPFVAIALIIAIFFGVIGSVIGSIVFFCVTAFVAFFFRNPERHVPEGGDLIVAPADGRIISVERGARAPHTDSESTKVSIFMSVLNVHINRFPITAVLKSVVYIAGQFFVASLDKASDKNERNIFVLEDEKGREIVMVQIAGLVARRIVCYLMEGDMLGRGERFGLIRFGSRVDLYLPLDATLEVKEGDRVRAGESIVGRFG